MIYNVGSHSTRHMNTDESTKGTCDNCGEPMKQCDCDISCSTCHDMMPRKHKCGQPDVCPHCDEPIDDCHCQPSGHYD